MKKADYYNYRSIRNLPEFRDLSSEQVMSRLSDNLTDHVSDLARVTFNNLKKLFIGYENCPQRSPNWKSPRHIELLTLYEAASTTALYLRGMTLYFN